MALATGSTGSSDVAGLEHPNGDDELWRERHHNLRNRAPDGRVHGAGRCERRGEGELFVELHAAVTSVDVDVEGSAGTGGAFEDSLSPPCDGVALRRASPDADHAPILGEAD